MGNAVTAATGASELLQVTTSGAVLAIGLNRPAKRNALNDGIIGTASRASIDKAHAESHQP